MECVHKLTIETNDIRNQRYTKRTIHETNDTRNERYTKRTNQLHERNANETNEKRKRCEIYVNLSDPGSVRRSQNYFSVKGLAYGD